MIASLYCTLVILMLGYTAGANNRPKRPAGGDAVKSHKYPWMVKIETAYKHGPGVRYMTCTGSFIDKFGSVLTASHCLYPIQHFFDQEWRFYEAIFTWGIYTMISSEINTETIYDQSTIIHHPDSYGITGTYSIPDIDLAIVHPKSYNAVPMDTSQINLGVIPLSEQTDIHNLPTANGIVAGFGIVPIVKRRFLKLVKHTKFAIPETLHEISLQYVGQAIPSNVEDGTIDVDSAIVTSRFMVSAAGSKVVQYHPKSVKAFLKCGFCGKGLELKGICIGDSGAPYMVLEDFQGSRRLVLRGVIVKTELDTVKGIELECTLAGDRATATDVNYGSIRAWINQKLQDRQSRVLGG